MGTVGEAKNRAKSTSERSLAFGTCACARLSLMIVNDRPRSRLPPSDDYSATFRHVIRLRCCVSSFLFFISYHEARVSSSANRWKEELAKAA